jgi:hypothetical protein
LGIGQNEGGICQLQKISILVVICGYPSSAEGKQTFTCIVATPNDGFEEKILRSYQATSGDHFIQEIYSPQDDG